jgi:predicted transcriptional regulator of viral defense system
MTRKPDHQDLYAIAEGRAGYFTSTEAASSGIGSQLLSHHTRAGTYRRAAHGVYRLANFPASRFEDLVIAWLRAGPRSAVSHTSALALYGLSDIIPGEVHVTIPRSGSRRRPGLRLHTADLPASAVSWREGVRVTTVARTIADLARSGLAEDRLRQVVQEALARGLTDREGLQKEANRRGHRVVSLIGRLLEAP